MKSLSIRKFLLLSVLTESRRIYNKASLFVVMESHSKPPGENGLELRDLEFGI